MTDESPDGQTSPMDPNIGATDPGSQGSNAAPEGSESGSPLEQTSPVQVQPASVQETKLSFEHYDVIHDSDGNPLILGTGGMGVTYRAWDTHLAREVAIKVIRPLFLEDEIIRERFIQEARALAQVSHANVVSVVHLGTTSRGEFYFAMEFLNGESLHAYIQRCGKLTPAWTLYFAQQIASALQATSNLGIIHRDIKPGNIILTPSGDGGFTATLIDFGLAKSLEAQAADGGVTMEGTFIGTPHYASPEQLRQHKLDIRSDIYSLGVVMFHMLTGKVPFQGSVAEVVSKHLYNEPEWSEIEAPKVVVQLLKQMMHKNPERRFQTPQQLHTEMGSVFQEALGAEEDEQLSTIVSGNLVAPRRSGKKKLLLIGGITAALVLVAAGVTVAVKPDLVSSLMASADQEEPPETNPSQPVVVLKTEDAAPAKGDGKGASSAAREEKEPGGPDKGSQQASQSGSSSGKGAEPVTPSEDSKQAAKGGSEKPASTPVVASSEPPKPKPESKPATPTPPKTEPAPAPPAKQAPTEWKIVLRTASEARDELRQEYTEKLADLNQFYLNHLNTVLDRLTGSSNLDGALEVSQEIKRIQSIRIDQIGGKMPQTKVAELRQGRKVYRERAIPVYQEYDGKLGVLRSTYDKLLDQEERKLEEGGFIVALEELREQRKGLFSGGGK